MSSLAAPVPAVVAAYSRASSPPPPPPQDEADPLALHAFAVPYPRPLPGIYVPLRDSKFDAPLPSAELNTVPLRLYNALIWIVCSCSIAYLLLEGEDRVPRENDMFLPLRKWWKEWKRKRRQQIADETERRQHSAQAKSIASTSSTLTPAAAS